MVTDLPLSNWRVLVTRPEEQAKPLSDALEEAGATVVLYPTIRLDEPPSWLAFDAAARNLASYAWIVFTSPSAVRFALARAPHLAAALSGAAAPTVAAVGSQTARALGERGISVARMPEPSEQNQAGLLAAFGDLPPGARVLFPQAVGGRELLQRELTRVGAIVDVVPVSRTLPLPLDAPPPPFDVATFASPSALTAFVARWTTAGLDDKTVAVIGPTTHAAASALGVPVHVEPAAPSVAALVEALCAYRARA